MHLYGDDFTPAQVAQWFDQERDASPELSGVDFPFYYSALNHIHAWKRIPGGLGTVLAIGCGNGNEFRQVAHRMSRLIAIEPARDWWRDSVNGVPADYRMPNLDGSIDLPDRSIDTAVCLGVLHHIPNVSAVLEEVVRVLKPGGRLVLREPISSMGDASKPRRGLTPNERGIPLPWLREKVRELGLATDYEAPCIFPLTGMTANLFGYVGPFNSRWITRLDALACKAMAWNIRYRRRTPWSKLAPGDVAMVLRKH